jgi:hypothetical protein
MNGDPTDSDPIDGEKERPSALGYICEDHRMSEEELAQATCVLREFADREGYTLGPVYVERVERTPAAFEALIATAIRDEVAAIVVPGFEHLQLIGSAGEMADHMAKTTGARVLNADMPVRPQRTFECEG